MNDLERMRHSAAHVMAAAVTDLIPGTLVAIGPPIDDGFYYDFELPRDLTPLSVDELQRCIAGLEAEITRARAAIAAKQDHRSGAESLFKR